MSYTHIADVKIVAIEKVHGIIKLRAPTLDCALQMSRLEPDVDGAHARGHMQNAD